MSGITKKTIELRTPDLGDTDRIELIQWFIKPGDLVQEGTEIVELVTDKASFPVEAPIAGRLLDILKPAGSIVVKDEVLGHLEISEE